LLLFGAFKKKIIKDFKKRYSFTYFLVHSKNLSREGGIGSAGGRKIMGIYSFKILYINYQII
jgi:hypothetical protein